MASMTVQTARSGAAAATLGLYDRVLHPELYASLNSVEVSIPTGLLRIDITEAGHLIVIRRNGLTLTELVGSYPGNSAPRQGRLVSTLARSGRDVSWSGRGVEYWASCHLDSVDNEVFERLDREMTLDAHRADLFCRIGSGNRMDPSAMSLVRVEQVEAAISIHITHTYPAERTLLRTQSLVEVY